MKSFYKKLFSGILAATMLLSIGGGVSASDAEDVLFVGFDELTDGAQSSLPPGFVSVGTDPVSYTHLMR